MVNNSTNINKTNNHLFSQTIKHKKNTKTSLLANPLARSPGQVKLDSDKWKLWKIARHNTGLEI